MRKRWAHLIRRVYLTDPLICPHCGGELRVIAFITEPIIKGVIAAFSPSGLSLNNPAHLYHKALLEELVRRGHERLGDAILAAQAAYAETGAFPSFLTIYHLFGDPALKLQ